MKTNKKAWISSIAIIAMLAIMSVTFAFKPSNKVVKFAPVTYYFHGSSAAQANLSAQWNTTPSGDQCGGTSIPCQVTVDSQVYPTISSYIGSRTSAQIMADVNVSKKAVE